MCNKDFGRGIYICTKFLPARVFKICSDIKFRRLKFVATEIFASGNFNLFTMVLVVPILHKLHAMTSNMKGLRILSVDKVYYVKLNKQTRINIWN